MFPLRRRSLIRGCQAHIRAGLGCGADYRSRYEPYYAPFSGRVSIPYPQYRNGKETSGGKWIRLTRANGEKIELAHISTYVKSSGRAREGELIAYTGNTGSVTSYPHAHIQILSRAGRRLDPETYNWEVSQNGTINVKALFREVWGREPARGEEMYFLKRLELGTIKPTKKDITDKMSYWYSVVYPEGKLSLSGNARWQYEKMKTLIGG